ncbi:lasso peptide biosynthesis B2 protein [Nocardiopsis sp. FIRDI 009]|uniref:lasso peptide biosynthesis B2 protein n=1 Tax=Nocardiopsis sp. FIRDI 009 TaxID=714197 RepID=UPI0018E50FE1|nr:lasso peptide biosynthesis B2 protein [Nocardiopsis sp. FIRDI 009]
MTNTQRACELDGEWLVVVDYRNGSTRLLDSVAAERWRRSSDVAPVKRVPWTPSRSINEVPMGWDPPPPVPLRTLAAVGVGLLVTMVAAVLGPRKRRMRRLVGLVRFATCLSWEQASAPLVEESVNAVRHYGFLPARIACLESSVAVVVSLVFQGRKVTWHHGVRSDPLVLHAWLSIDGEPVAEPPSTRRCATLLTIPSQP